MKAGWNMLITANNPLINTFVTRFGTGLEEKWKNWIQFMITGICTIEKPSIQKFNKRISEGEHWRTVYRRINRYTELGIPLLTQFVTNLQKDQKMRMHPNGRFLIDEHIIPRTGRKMEAVSVQYATSRKTVLPAHSILVLYYWDGTKHYPVAYLFYRRLEELKKRNLEHLFQEKNVLIRKLITQARRWGNHPILCVMDSFFFTKENVKFFKKNGISFVSRPKKSMKVKYQNQWCSLADLAASIPDSEYCYVPVYNRLTQRTSYALIAVRDVYFHSIGHQRIVISKKKGSYLQHSKSEEEDCEDLDAFCLFVTNEVTWSGRHILEIYRTRWSIETFFEEMNQNLGFHSGRFSSLSSQITWLDLCFLCHFFLTWSKLYRFFGSSISLLTNVGTLKQFFLIHYVSSPVVSTLPTCLPIASSSSPS